MTDERTDTTHPPSTDRLDRYDYYRGPKPLADRWTATRDTLRMRCSLSTHRLGWELRLTAGSNFRRSQVCKTEREVHETSDAWKAEAISKGWTV